MFPIISMKVCCYFLQTIIAAATAPQSKWVDEGVKLRSAAVSLTVLWQNEDFVEDVYESVVDFSIKNLKRCIEISFWKDRKKTIVNASFWFIFSCNFKRIHYFWLDNQMKLCNYVFGVRLYSFTLNFYFSKKKVGGWIHVIQCPCFNDKICWR